MSPFLFILTMEGLHIAMDDAVSKGVFREAQLESDDLAISHLFYADYAIFLGCSTDSFLFVCLGIPVGESMVRVKG